MVQALVKGERSELAVELLTELGVDEIVPWAAQRCVATWVPEKSPRRWEQAAAEASKQARRSRWPEVAPLANTERVRDRLAASGGAYVLHEEATASLAALVAPPAGAATPTTVAPAGELVIVVGPEGGLTERELAGLRFGRSADRAARAERAARQHGRMCGGGSGAGRVRPMELTVEPARPRMEAAGSMRNRHGS